jgi:hypothetical protein
MVLEGILLWIVVRGIGRTRNERHLVALCAGILVPVAVFGFLSEISVPLILIADVAALLFFRTLWRRYSSETSPKPPERTEITGRPSLTGPQF